MDNSKQWVLWLRVENLFIFAAALVAFHWLGASWWTFLALFLAPDLSLLGYVAGKRVGAVIYNGVHSCMAPAIWLVVSLALGAFDPRFTLEIALIWAAHIAMDRALGFGLKSTLGFRDTHLGFVGQPAG